MQYFFFGGGGGGAARMSQPPVLCIPAFRLFFLTSSSSISPVSIPFRRGGEVPTSRTLHSRLAHALLFQGFLSPLTCDAQTYFRSSLLYGGREATTGNTSALRKLSQATVLLALFRLRNSAKYLIQ